MPRPLALLLPALLTTRPSPSAPPACRGIAVTTVPARVMPGTLFMVRVTGTPSDAVLSGDVVGEPMHFSPVSKAMQSFAPAPIDSTALHITVRCARDGAVDSLRVSVALAAPQYKLESLRVAPEFSATPDSALAAREAREAKVAAEVNVASHDTPRLWRDAFAAPRDSRITSVFGGGRTFNGTVTSRHMGTDWAGRVGAPIRAMNRGVVRVEDRFYLGGNVVYVDHGDGLVSAYLHMSKQLVSVGDTVERGAVIGLVGATGRVTGPHLHVIARYGRVSVDPQSVLRVTRSSARGTRRTARE